MFLEFWVPISADRLKPRNSQCIVDWSWFSAWHAQRSSILLQHLLINCPTSRYRLVPSLGTLRPQVDGRWLKVLCSYKILSTVSSVESNSSHDRSLAWSWVTLPAYSTVCYTITSNRVGEIYYLMHSISGLEWPRKLSGFNYDATFNFHLIIELNYNYTFVK